MNFFDYIKNESFFKPLTFKYRRIYYDCIRILIDRSKELPVLYESDAKDSITLYLKNEEIYNIFNTQKFLNRPVEVAVSNTSGAAGIAHWIDSHYRLKGDQKVDKNSELVKMIKSWVDQQYEDGRVTVLCDTELEAIVAETCQRLGITLK